ncbi:hypothetical protein D9756_011243 [Leucocoprinus leucothites]|uniref:Uncharacterized protein n=1 Tax=Leucocoprinus leucothites TaxID=201217 RepID=A0A8H5CPG7_9AGAR|nr:hypothetical protein D9756_011243 [Leucoagaricus leucothites]
MSNSESVPFTSPPSIIAQERESYAITLKWDFLKTDNGWHITSVETGHYLAVEGRRNTDHRYADGTRVIATKEPYTWDVSSESVHQSQGIAFRFLVPGANQALEFCYHGVLREGRIWESLPKNQWPQQQWELDEIKKVVVIIGTGSDAAEGAAAAAGYAIAILDIQGENMKQLQRELDYMIDVEAVTFPMQSFSLEAIAESCKTMKDRFPSSSYDIRVGIWNVQQPFLKRFLSLTSEDLEKSAQINSIAAFEFARQMITTMRSNTSLEVGNGKKGTLIFRGATASLEGKIFTSAFSPAMFALRSLSQCLNKEFASENIHVAHVITDSLSSNDSGVKTPENEDLRCKAESLAKAYLYLIEQDRSAWTWELDLRPAQSSPKRALRLELLDLLSKVDDIL